jgi:hypothetical protein
VNSPQKYLNSPAAKPSAPMTVLFYFPDKNTSASCEIACSVFDSIKAGAEREGISIGEFISQAVALKNQPAKVGKNFVAINMAQWKQKEMRELARECGWPLRSILGWGLRDAVRKLENMVNVQRKTGRSLYAMGLTGLPWQKLN